MCTEIEAKLKVGSLREVERRLAGVGARFVSEKLQRDIYFDDASGALAEGDRCLRLRVESGGESERFFLTYKGARQKDDFKKRQEIEVEITDADSAENLLSAIGYQQVLLFEKKRRTWQLGECVVALDELPLLGTFVEIEGPDDKRITEAQRSLGLDGLPHIAESYACLMNQKLAQLGCEKREVLL